YSGFQGGGCGPEHIREIWGSYIGFEMASVNLLSVLSTTTPLPTPTSLTSAITASPTPKPTIQAGFVGCYPDMRAGGAARTRNNCWVGVVDGYEVSITTGTERYMGGKDS